MQTGFLIGRIVLGLYYLSSALMGLVNLQAMSGYAGAMGVPAPQAAVIVSHLFLLVAGVSFLFGWRPTLGVLAVVVFMIPVTFKMHAFWGEMPAQMKQMQMINFTKNMALLASALMFLAIPRPWPYSLDRGPTPAPA